MLKQMLQDKSLSRPDANVASWNPVREFSDLQRRMDDVFSRAFGYTPLSALLPNQVGSSLLPEADIYETSDKVVVVCPLPGFEANQIQVQATEQTITVSAERQPLFTDETMQPYRLGYLSGQTQCQAAFGLPDEIDPNKISARFKNGVLHLEAPKSERAKHKSVTVRITG